MENNNQNEQNNTSNQSKILALLPAILSIASICLQTIGIFLSDLTSSAIIKSIFFLFAAGCAIASTVMLFIIKKQVKFDPVMVLNLIAIFICFQ